MKVERISWDKINAKYEFDTIGPSMLEHGYQTTLEDYSQFVKHDDL